MEGCDQGGSHRETSAACGSYGGSADEASGLYNAFVRTPEADRDDRTRASQAIICLELSVVRENNAAPTAEHVKATHAELSQWSATDVEAMARMDAPVGNLLEGGMDRTIVGDIRMFAISLKAQRTTTKKDGPHRTVNVESRLQALNLTDLPAVLRPDTALVRAILLQMEDGIRLPLELSPQKSPLFPSTEAHAIAHAPARTKVSDEVLEVAKGRLGEAADTAHKSILLQVSARLESEQLPATLHVLLRIRHVIGLLVCEAVPAKEHLRLMVHVGMLPLVAASHLCTKGCYHAGAKYEAQTFKRAHEGSRDIPGSRIRSLRSLLSLLS
ncbi:hypothetical protein DIPPA_09852 [Diplonema papillatum]|nr:hypothetical protein DIPPA_09852 [Diplonema papillatum]